MIGDLFVVGGGAAMIEIPVYKYRDFMDEDFPFKMEIRTNDHLNQNVHAHEHLQICYVMKGTCLHFVNGRQLSLVKGDIFSIPPFLEHTMKPVAGSEVEVIQIDFMPFFINENMRDLNQMDGFIDFAYIQPFVSLEDGLLPKLNVSADNQIMIERLLSDMHNELLLQEEGYRLSIKADLLKLLVIVGREFKRFLGGKQDKKIYTHRRAFHETIQYMREHYQEEIKLDMIAEKAAMAPTYFCYVFKLMTGRSFVEYLNEIRIRHAMDYLKQSDKTVTEICWSVGFNHLGHFNRVFKKVTGVTPSQYKKTNATW